jgi:hypothetical protein
MTYYKGESEMNKEEQKQLAQDTIKDLIGNQKKGDSIAEDLIVLLGATDENFENPLTQELEYQMDTLTGDKLKALKSSIKNELQTRIKMPIVQRESLDTVKEPERHKKFKLTIKKVKSTMIGDDFPFTADDLGKFKVIITPSKKTEEKTFEEELMTLMDKHGRTVSDVRIFCDNFAGE